MSIPLLSIITASGKMIIFIGMLKFYLVFMLIDSIRAFTDLQILENRHANPYKLSFIFNSEDQYIIIVNEISQFVYLKHTQKYFISILY